MALIPSRISSTFPTYPVLGCHIPSRSGANDTGAVNQSHVLGLFGVRCKFPKEYYGSGVQGGQNVPPEFLSI
jgi:hypothetical protein